MMLIFFCAMLFAKTQPVSLYEQIEAARSSKEIERIQAEYKQKGVYRLVCLEQKKLGKIPWACYAAGESGPDLDILCHRSARAVQRVADMPSLIRRRHLPPQCEDEVNMRESVLIYKEGSQF